MARSAGGWRMLPAHFGPLRADYWWFRRFVRRLLFRTIHDVALMLDREAAGRETNPTGGVLDNQTAEAPFAGEPAMMATSGSSGASALSPWTRARGCRW